MPAAGGALAVYHHQFGESGKGEAQFRVPRYLCVTADSNLCVSDTINQRLQILTPDGEFVESLCEAGAAPGEIRGPSGVVCDGNHLFVVEAGNHRVQKLAFGDGNHSNGTPLGKAGTHGAKRSGDLWCPQGVAIAKRLSSDQRELFVADMINARISVYDAGNMEFLRTIGEKGSEQGQLDHPSGLAIRGEEVFVSEVGNHRISVFAKKGAFERCYGSKGSKPGELFEPRGLAFAKGWLFVAEATRVSILSPGLEANACKQIIEIPQVGQLWGACALDAGEGVERVFMSDIHAGKAKVHVLNVVGEPYDEGLSPAEVAAKLARQKKEAEDEKLREWQEARAKSQGKVA